MVTIGDGTVFKLVKANVASDVKTAGGFKPLSDTKWKVEGKPYPVLENADGTFDIRIQGD